MQQDRRTTPYPRTWEIPLTAAMVTGLVLVLAAHLARATANALTGTGWALPPQAELFTSLPALLGGDSRAGLTPAPAAPPALLYTCLAVTEVLAIALLAWAARLAWRAWGPGTGSRDGHPRPGPGHARTVAAATGRPGCAPRPVRQPAAPMRGFQPTDVGWRLGDSARTARRAAVGAVGPDRRCHRAARIRQDARPAHPGPARCPRGRAGHPHQDRRPAAVHRRTLQRRPPGRRARPVRARPRRARAGLGPHRRVRGPDGRRTPRQGLHRRNRQRRRRPRPG